MAMPRYGPSDMLDDYKAIPVRVGGETVSVAVNRYRNNAYASAATGGTQDGVAVKGALLALDRGMTAEVGGDQAFVDVFTGKGSPEAIAGVLAALARRAERFVHAHGRRSDAAGRVATALAGAGGWQARLQAVCDIAVGLDCNGFVGNWLRRCNPGFGIGPNASIRGIFNRRRRTREAPAEVQYWDLLVWADFSHIAAIDAAGDASGRGTVVCQSAGGGPRRNRYWLARRGTGTPARFTLGGRGRGDVGGDVHVVSLWD
jgi:hypothetical protein